MADTLHIDTAVITGDDLRRQYQSQDRVSVKPGAVLTPTAWDFLREHSLSLSRVSRDDKDGSTAASGAGAPQQSGREPGSPREIGSGEQNEADPEGRRTRAAEQKAPAEGRKTTAAERTAEPSGADGGPDRSAAADTAGDGLSGNAGGGQHAAASIREIAPPQMVCVGRCDLPDRSYGCQTEEFGSGYAAGTPAAQNDGQDESAAPSLPQGSQVVEDLIQRVTDLVMEELARQ